MVSFFDLVLAASVCFTNEKSECEKHTDPAWNEAGIKRFRHENRF